MKIENKKDLYKKQLIFKDLNIGDVFIILSGTNSDKGYIYIKYNSENALNATLNNTALISCNGEVEVLDATLVIN